jgi:selenide,water dikinase
VPLIDGARDTVARGIFSSLQPQNVRLRRAIRALDAASEHPLYPLLFDPQTAGGLVASVPGSQAEACIAALQAAGYANAAVIGFVAERSAALEPIMLDLTGAMLEDFLAQTHAARDGHRAGREYADAQQSHP